MTPLSVRPYSPPRSTAVRADYADLIRQGEQASSCSARAEIHLALGDFDAAINDYEAALKTGHAFGPQVAEAYLRRAEHREATGDTAGREHAEALRANPFGVPSE